MAPRPTCSRCLSLGKECTYVRPGTRKTTQNCDGCRTACHRNCSNRDLSSTRWARFDVPVPDPHPDFMAEMITKREPPSDSEYKKHLSTRTHNQCSVASVCHVFGAAVSRATKKQIPSILETFKGTLSEQGSFAAECGDGSCNGIIRKKRSFDLDLTQDDPPPSPKRIRRSTTAAPGADNDESSPTTELTTCVRR